MGTRNLTVVRDLDEEIVVAQYGQWDGYPSGQGITILNTLNAYGWIPLTVGLTHCRYATQAELDEIYSQFQNTEGYMTSEQANLFIEQYPALSRDTGGEIIRQIIETDKDILLVNNYDFKDDELFCEGYYEIDLPNGKFISKYADKTIEFDLDNLPTAEEYLKSFEKDLTNAE